MTPPSGSVQFFDGTLLLGTGTIGLVGGVATATIATTALTGVAHTSITAKYLGDGNYAVMTSDPATVTVDKATVTPTLAASATRTASGGAVTFTATLAAVSGGSIPRGTVQFRDNGVAIGLAVAVDANGNAAFTPSGLTQLSIGLHALTAVYLPASTETNYRTATSAAAEHTVTGTATSTTTLASSLPASTLGQAVTLTATVSVAAGGIAPTGEVEFWDGSTLLGRGTLALVSGLYRAAFTTSALSTGSRSIKARFLGNTTYRMSESSILTQTVG
jgi:hypothetical protein